MTPHTSLSALDPHSPVRLFPDDEFRIVNATDASKQLAFDLSAIATGTTRTVTIPDASGTMALLERAQTFTKLATFALGLTVAGAAFASRGIQDDATARALSLSGAGANSVTIANSATSPILGTTAGALLVSPAGIATALFSPAASVGNYFDIAGAITGGNPVIFARGVSDADVQFSIASKGAGSVAFLTDGGATLQAYVAHVAGANRYLILKGANGGDPSIAASAGRLWLNNTNILLNGGAGNTLQYLDVYNGDTGAAAGAILRFITSDAAGTGLTTGHIVKYKTGAMYLANNENSAAGLLAISTYSTASVALYTRNNTSPGLEIVDSGGVNNRWVQILGSNGGNPTIGTSGGSLFLTSAGQNVGLLVSGGAASGFATLAAAGTTPAGLVISGNIIALYGQGAEQVRITGVASANRFITLTGSNGGSPTIGTSAGALTLAPAGANIILSGSATMLQANYGAFSGGEWSRDANWGTYYKAPAVGGVADIGLHSNDGFSSIRIGGTAAPGTVRFFTGTSAATENGRVFADGSWSLGLAAAPILTLSPDAVQATQRRIIITAGAAAGNPTIGTSGGNLAISSTVVGAGDFQARAATATPAGGMAAIYMGTNGYSIGFGSGAPTYIASKGSLYLRSDGSTTNNRMYVATDSAGNWTAVTTAA